MRKLLVLSLLSLTACSYSANPLPESETTPLKTGQPALHAVDNAQLRELMDKMNALMQERFMTEPELDTERRKYAVRIAGTAEKLSQNMNAMTDVLPTLKLNSSEQQTFLALVGKLRHQAQILRQQAKQNQIDAIDNTLHEITTTCTSCHALFRNFNQ